MVNENELMISNKSYINKDFASIYPELLDYVKILTSKWNPQTSNESDPGIVLLKLASFMGDKLNYNTDKNVLENFALSCTQESSMRKNLYPLGYSMGYYHSATTMVQFTYLGDMLDPSKGKGRSFTLPALDTVVTSEDGSVQFVLTQPLTIEERNSPRSVLAIQGRKDTLTVGDSDTILLENIDSNNRLYFPVAMVAENGVYISRSDGHHWDRVDNLNTVATHQDVFMFGYDSARGLPYIEFPSDIADLIGDGLHIDYIITSGRDGNVSARTLTKIVNPSSVPVSGSTGSTDTISFTEGEGSEASLLSIRNLQASIDGANPETIDEAYNSFKRTVGTFDTLVTCRDYANYIYNMEDAESMSPVVSNVQVSDRRDDLTYSTGVVSFDSYGQNRVNVLNPTNKDVTPYLLFLYPLAPVTSYTIEGYNGSFKPLNQKYIESLTNVDSLSYITNRLEESKCASHNYHDFRNTPGSAYALKNMLRLDARIATTHKVNSYERKDIVANVIGALIERFNARNVDYGYEIPYSEILSTIEKADPRISYVNLLEPALSTRVLKANGEEVDLISSEGLDFLLSLLAHNILAGRVELFDYDDEFDYDLGHVRGRVLTELASISTSTRITLKPGVPGKVMGHEVVQLVAPSLVTDISYTAYTYYCAENLASTIKDGTNYQLRSGETVWIYYTDSTTKSPVARKYSKGDIIQPKGFNMENTAGGGTVEKEFTYGNETITKGFLMLDARSSLNIRKLNRTEFGKPTYFYWIRNNAGNTLFSPSESRLDATATTSSTSLDVTLDSATYLAKSGVSEPGTADVVYSSTGSAWKLGGTAIVPSEYGLTIVGTPADGDTITIVTASIFDAMLGDGEYVYYTDEGFNNLVSLGSGTTIRSNITTNPSAPEVTYEEIARDGLLSLRDKWKYLPLTKASNPDSGTWLVAQENSILTLTEGDTLTWNGTGSSLSLGNDLKAIDGSISYTLADGTEPSSLEAYSLTSGDSRWKARARLDIDAGRDYAQAFTREDLQEITFRDRYYDASKLPSDPANRGHWITIDSANGATNMMFNLNMAYQFAGSSHIDVTSRDILDTSKKIYPFSVYCYGVQNQGLHGNTNGTPERGSSGYAGIVMSNPYRVAGTDDAQYAITDSGSFGKALVHYQYLYVLEDGAYVGKTSYEAGKEYLYMDSGSMLDYDIPSIGEVKLLMVYLDSDPDNGKPVIITSEGTGTVSTAGGIRLYNTYTEGGTSNGTLVDWGTSIELTHAGIYTIEMEPTVSHITVMTMSGTECHVTVDLPRFVVTDGSTPRLNKALGITDEVAKSLGSYTRGDVESLLLATLHDLDNHRVVDGKLVPAPVFYYTNRVLNSRALNRDNLLDPLALYDANNVASKFTISQIDMSNIGEDIDIMRSSRL